jgi:hypothetical protein
LNSSSRIGGRTDIPSAGREINSTYRVADTEAESVIAGADYQLFLIFKRSASPLPSFLGDIVPSLAVTVPALAGTGPEHEGPTPAESQERSAAEGEFAGTGKPSTGSSNGIN